MKSRRETATGCRKRAERAASAFDTLSRVSAVPLLDLLFPRICVLCAGSAWSMDLCPGCAADLPRIRAGCRRCGLPLGQPDSICGSCQLLESPLCATVVPYHYRFPADRLVQQLKFHRRLCCANAMAVLIARHGQASLRALDALVPVPLNRWRSLKRGFNQAEEIARRLASLVELPCRTAVLARHRRTAEQSGLSRERRVSNVAGAFSARSPILTRQHIGLVDDVITTGATIREAGRVLLEAGASRVTAIAFARADKGSRALYR